MRTKRAAVTWMSVAVAASAALTLVMYDAGYHAELGSRAGAEPVFAGLLIAAPFFALFLFHVPCVIGAAIAESRAGRIACMAASAALSGLAPVLVLWIFSQDPDPIPWSIRIALAALLLPLIPAWVAHLRAHSSEATEPSPRVDGSTASAQSPAAGGR